MQVSPVILAKRKGKASGESKATFPAPTLAMVQQAFQMLDPTGSGTLNPYAIADVPPPPFFSTPDMLCQLCIPSLIHECPEDCHLMATSHHALNPPPPIHL